MPHLSNVPTTENLTQQNLFKSTTAMMYENTLDFAQGLDAQDPLRTYREQFLFPQHQGRDVLYCCGNSLGLQPRSIRSALLHELDHWAEHGVEGHFRGELPWMHYHKFLTDQSARLVGALPHEVVVMNTLTVNLHLMLVSFYQPTAQRYKIVMEAGAFPSDQYALETQVRFHGLDPAEAIVEIAPRPGEDTLRTEDIIQIIEKEGDSLALVLFGGVNYYTGQFYDLAAITAAAHRVGAKAGFDLAHAAGNVPLRLHDWGADFAVWCSYKYLNSGPGGPAGVFVHERHANSPHLPRFAGCGAMTKQSVSRCAKAFSRCPARRAGRSAMPRSLPSPPTRPAWIFSMRRAWTTCGPRACSSPASWNSCCWPPMPEKTTSASSRPPIRRRGAASSRC